MLQRNLTYIEIWIRENSLSALLQVIKFIYYIYDNWHFTLTLKIRLHNFYIIYQIFSNEQCRNKNIKEKKTFFFSKNICTFVSVTDSLTSVKNGKKNDFFFLVGISYKNSTQLLVLQFKSYWTLYWWVSQLSRTQFGFLGFRRIRFVYASGIPLLDLIEIFPVNVDRWPAIGVIITWLVRFQNITF